MRPPHDDELTLPNGVRLALRRTDGGRRPFLLVHGLASNARLWDAVAGRLADAGHEVVAVDQRGHGRSAAPADGYDTPTCADDLAALCGALGFVGDRRPVVAGQSWGGNVALSFAAPHPAPAALALVDGGWLRLRDRFATFDECWAQLAPPRFDHLRMAELAEHIRERHADWPPESVDAVLANFVELPDGAVRARLDRAHHKSILFSLWADDPRELYPLVDVPVLLMPAASAHEARPDVLEALELLPDAHVEWYAGAHHDLHAEQPDRVAADLLELAAKVTPR
jgi:pimeloyl-ACP methyl ester carboxylesterase